MRACANIKIIILLNYINSKEGEEEAPPEGAAPAEGAAPPAEEGAPPAEGAAPPAEGGEAPAPTEGAPAEEGAPPAEGTPEAPPEGQPAEGAPPAEGEGKPEEPVPEPPAEGFEAFKELVISESYDLIALPETCFDITPEKTEERSIPNYSLLHSGHKDDKEGVAFYVKNSIKFKVIDMTEGPGPINFEQLLAILKQCAPVGETPPAEGAQVVEGAAAPTEGAPAPAPAEEAPTPAPAEGAPAEEPAPVPAPAEEAPAPASTEAPATETPAEAPPAPEPAPVEAAPAVEAAA